MWEKSIWTLSDQLIFIDSCKHVVFASTKQILAKNQNEPALTEKYKCHNLHLLFALLAPHKYKFNLFSGRDLHIHCELMHIFIYIYIYLYVVVV